MLVVYFLPSNREDLWFWFLSSSLFGSLSPSGRVDGSFSFICCFFVYYCRFLAFSARMMLVNLFEGAPVRRLGRFLLVVIPIASPPYAMILMDWNFSFGAECLFGFACYLHFLGLLVYSLYFCYLCFSWFSSIF